MSTDKDGAKLPVDRLKEIARNYGVEVVDAADSGIRAIGILGGVSWKYHKTLEAREDSTNNNEP